MSDFPKPKEGAPCQQLGDKAQQQPRAQSTSITRPALTALNEDDELPIGASDLPDGSSPARGAAGTSGEQQQEQQPKQQRAQQKAELKEQREVGGSAPAGGYDQPGLGTGILLRMETTSATETRRLLGTLEVVVRLSVILMIVLLVLKWRRVGGEDLFCSPEMNVANLAFSALELGVLLAVALWCTRSYLIAIRSGQAVSARRRKVMISHAIQLLVTLLGISCYFMANAVAVGSVSCADPATQRAIAWLSFVRFTCWNTLFLIFTVRAHNTCILLPPVEKAAAVAVGATPPQSDHDDGSSRNDDSDGSSSDGGSSGSSSDEEKGKARGSRNGMNGSSPADASLLLNSRGGSGSSASSSGSRHASSSASRHATRSTTPSASSGGKHCVPPSPFAAAMPLPLLLAAGRTHAKSAPPVTNLSGCCPAGDPSLSSMPEGGQAAEAAAEAAVAPDAIQPDDKKQRRRQRRKQRRKQEPSTNNLLAAQLQAPKRGITLMDGLTHMGSAAADFGSAAVDTAVGGSFKDKLLGRLKHKEQERLDRYEATTKRRQRQQRRQEKKQQKQQERQKRKQGRAGAQQQGQQQQQQQGQQQQQEQELSMGYVPSTPDRMVVDLPWRFHWPKLIPWVMLETCQVVLAIVATQNASDAGTCSLAPTCSPRYCDIDSLALGLTISSIILVTLWYTIFVALMWRSRSLLRKRPWQLHRAANAAYRLEARLGLWAYSIIFVAIVLFYMVGYSSCSHYSFQYYGLVPTELVWCTVTTIGCFLFSPVNTKLSQPVLVTALQDFAWTEHSLPEKLRQRNAAAHGKLDSEPMFCYETAVKLFYWSCLCYDYNESGAWVSPMKEHDLEQLLKGMSLYALDCHKEIEVEETHLKALFAWNAHTIVIAFRGSAAAVNFIADAMVWQAVHPPSRGTWYRRPKVHSGFLRCWTAGGLDKRVLSTASMLINSCLEPSKLKIYLTGHSLGGALATLAAYDIVKGHPHLKPHQISCYTFGCPRTGNRAFAIDYEKTVPDTWHVINDQDVVPRGGKFISLYKRNGQRVIVNKDGDLIVRPVPLESSLLQMPFGSNPMHHMLAAYQAALAAVALGQLDALKAMPGGPQGLMDLVTLCPVVAESMYKYGERSMVMWLGVRVWHTLASRAPSPKPRAPTERLPLPHQSMADAVTDPPPGGSSRGSSACGGSPRGSTPKQQGMGYRGMANPTTGAMSGEGATTAHAHDDSGSSRGGGSSGRNFHSLDLAAAHTLATPMSPGDGPGECAVCRPNLDLRVVVDHTLRPARSAPHALTIIPGTEHERTLQRIAGGSSSATHGGSSSSSGGAIGTIRRAVQRMSSGAGRRSGDTAGTGDDISGDRVALSMGVRRTLLPSGVKGAVEEAGTGAYISRARSRSFSLGGRAQRSGSLGSVHERPEPGDDMV